MPLPQVVFVVGAVVGLFVALADALAIQRALPPGLELISGDLRREIWLSWSKDLVPLVVLPGLAAASLRNSSQVAGPTVGPSATLPIVGACVWLAGAAVAQCRWWGGDAEGGWFNYAPDTEAFSPGGALAGQHIGLAIAWVGLIVSAAASASIAARSFRRARADGTGEPSDGVRRMNRLLAASQLIVLVVGPVVVARIVWLLATRPGFWGRI